MSETKKIAIGIASVLLADVLLSSSLLFFKNQNIDYINKNVNEITVNKANNNKTEKIPDGEYLIKDINQSKKEIQFTDETGDGLYSINADNKHYNINYKDDIDSDKIIIDAPNKKVNKTNDYISFIPDFDLYSDKARINVYLNDRYSQNNNE